MNEAGERAHRRTTHSARLKYRNKIIVYNMVVDLASWPYHDIMSDVFVLKQLVNIKLHVIKIKCCY